jgi:hypothetical protein
MAKKAARKPRAKKARPRGRPVLAYGAGTLAGGPVGIGAVALYRHRKYGPGAGARKTSARKPRKRGGRQRRDTRGKFR